jgi:hypothetical protein
MERNHAKWRVNRKLLVQQFTSMTSTRTVTEHAPIIEAESAQLLHEFLHSPEGFMEHAIRFASSVMTSIGSSTILSFSFLPPRVSIQTLIVILLFFIHFGLFPPHILGLFPVPASISRRRLLPRPLVLFEYPRRVQSMVFVVPSMITPR